MKWRPCGTSFRTQTCTRPSSIWRWTRAARSASRTPSSRDTSTCCGRRSASCRIRSRETAQSGGTGRASTSRRRASSTTVWPRSACAAALPPLPSPPSTPPPPLTLRPPQVLHRPCFLRGLPGRAGHVRVAVRVADHGLLRPVFDHWLVRGGDRINCGAGLRHLLGASDWPRRRERYRGQVHSALKPCPETTPTTHPSPPPPPSPAVAASGSRTRRTR